MKNGAGSSGSGQGGFHLMSCLKDVPTLRGNNYSEWRKKVDMALCITEVDWVLEEPQPVAPTEPVRDADEDDESWEKKQWDCGKEDMSYSIRNRLWINANKKCLAFIKNTIETTILGSVAECPTAKEMLNKIKSQFSGSSKTYATHLIKQLVTESYNGGGHGIREHILRMSNTAAKLKPMDADLEIKPTLLVHLVMASLPKEFETFVVNYNMQPETWDIEKVIAMCSQEEERIKASHGVSLNYVKEKKKVFPPNLNSPSNHRTSSKARLPSIISQSQ
ncbi:uncharacterized protein LOC123398782 [Hordeum vulgare subsp. vulgare]|uniref:uncharacterized protein LOC123398782 n=1 Tax=Hordeum vulgare subsp. vulgare TaxID=112509 RepID=UPI001D1A39CD|nr:uncharacterized protein LOC123398782 [Hordeum vulgare subsp. vulgare]